MMSITGSNARRDPLRRREFYMLIYSCRFSRALRLKRLVIALLSSPIGKGIAGFYWLQLGLKVAFIVRDEPRDAERDRVSLYCL